jgi:hypothetical protein
MGIGHHRIGHHRIGHCGESSPCAWGHAPGAMRHAINVRAQYDYCYNIYFINHLSVQTLPCHDRLALKS